MRKSVLLMILLFAVGMTASAQKFALIDMEYILKNIPAYERANEQLNQASKKWQSEVEKVAEELKRCTRTINRKPSSFLKNKKERKRKRLSLRRKKPLNFAALILDLKGNYSRNVKV